MSPEQLFASVVRVAPSFASVHREHLEDNDALLPHVLMAELLHFVGGRLCERAHTSPEVLAILELLESEVAGGNADTENVIALSFLEHLEAESFFVDLYELLGPKLRAAHTPFARQPSPSQDAA